VEYAKEFVYGAIFGLSIPASMVCGAVLMSYLCSRFPTFDRWFGGD
jgi:hypothetical protein